MSNLIFCLGALVLFTIGCRLIKSAKMFTRVGGDAYNKRQMRRTVGLMLLVISAVLVALAVVNAASSLAPTVDGVAQLGSGDQDVHSTTPAAPSAGARLINVPTLRLASSPDSSAPGLVDVPAARDVARPGQPPTLLHSLSSDSPDVKPADDAPTSFSTGSVLAPAMASGPDSATSAPATDSADIAPPRKMSPAPDAAKLQQLNDGIEAVNGILAKDPSNLIAYVQRGNAYGNEGKWDLAKKDYEKVLALDGKSKAAAFNLAEIDFMQSNYDTARAGFVALEQDGIFGDLAKYNVFLCDLFGGHGEAAEKELNVFNQVGSEPSYYYANAAWSFYHKKDDDGNDWLQSARRIFSREKCGVYVKPLWDAGYISN